MNISTENCQTVDHWLRNTDSKKEKRNRGKDIINYKYCPIYRSLHCLCYRYSYTYISKWELWNKYLD